MRNYKKECQGVVEDVMLRILEEWLAGRGTPITWESLVQALTDTDLNALADEVKDAKLS